MNSRLRYRGSHCTPSGFTLLESMLASSLLFVIVVAVLSAITSGQQNAYESHVRIAGTLAAEDLMGRLSATDYATLSSWNNHTENVGAMTDQDSFLMPEMFDMIGRRVTVTTVLQNLPNSIKVRGKLITVEAFDRNDRVACSLQQFVPEPMS